MVKLTAYKEKAEDGGLWAMVSTNSVDRTGDIIEPSAFVNLNDYLQKNPVILFGHDHWKPPIGKAVDGKILDNGLALKIVFADTPLGREVQYLYDNGFMNAFSVGVIPIEYEPIDTGYRFKKVELVEVSAVPVPANREAVAIRALEEKGYNEYKSLIQTANKPNSGKPEAGKSREVRLIKLFAEAVK